jgi:hypothetical protein
MSGILQVNLTFAEMMALGDCASSYYCHNLPLHPFITLDTIKEIIDIYIWLENFVNLYPNRTYNSQLGIGFLIKEMFDHLAVQVQSFRNSDLGGTQTEPSFLLWSGHDATIMALFAAYGVIPDKWVPFASMLIIELYQVEGENEPAAVRMIYNEEEVIIPGCGAVLCDWNTYRKIVNSIIPVHYPNACALQG